MVDHRVVATKLEQIEQYHGELTGKQHSLSRTEFLSETTEQRAVERMFENAIQACADLAQHIATRDFDYDGGSSKGAIRALAEQGVIDEATMHTLVEAVGFRNVLAHEYGTVDAGQVYELLQTKLAVYDSFSRQVAQWVQQQD
jgi:uncharacterized protein YutE (UPF0331/DUF86 family)